MSREKFFALGDSVTQGVGDELQDGSYLGWPRRLAAMLEDYSWSLDVVNLAVPHARAPQVRIKQLPEVAGIPALIASVIIGMNDALGSFSVGSYRRDYETIVAELSKSARIVLTATLSDISPRRGLSPADAAAVSSKIRNANLVIREVAAKYHAVCLDAAAVPEPSGNGFWLADGLHPNPCGHQQIAAAFATLLTERFQLAPAGSAAPVHDRTPVDPQGFARLAADPRQETIAPALAENAELWTPASRYPFIGRETVSTVLEIFLRDVVTDIGYDREFEQAGSFCMTFHGSISGAACEGVDIVELGADGLVRRCTVFIRPLAAVLAMSRKMVVSLRDVSIQIPEGSPPGGR